MRRITRTVRGEGGRILGRRTRGEPPISTSVSNTLFNDDGSGVGRTGEGEGDGDGDGDGQGDVGDVGGLAGEGDVNIVLPTLQQSRYYRQYHHHLHQRYKNLKWIILKLLTRLWIELQPI